ncbi:hypothetical protein HPB49_024502 [Dermacentor silvarum]|uniref:Uncharacterized protein n=1 Tax=Dermacentor silvarum TaxID=543639 RepID=A0ACB8DLL8_DERSI|nr:hypothetical protein HPB49_024502 [Dermacentor silvarum]
MARRSQIRQECPYYCNKSINKDRFSIACYRALPAAMDQLEEEWRPPTLDDPWRLQLWPYRPHSPIVWFAQVDAQLYVNGVSSQLWRYLLLKREIPTDVFSRLDLPSSDQNMYEGLKTAFFRHFGVPVPDHLRSTTQFPSTADASEGMAQTTWSSSPSAPGERCATARESCAAPTPQEPLFGDNKTTAPPASRSFPDDEQPPATLPAPSTTQLVSPLVLSNDHLASTPELTKESACTPPPPELHDVPSPSRGDYSAASRALTALGTHISPPVPSEILRQHCGETSPAAITCTALPSYASVFPVEPLSPAPSRNTRSVSRLQRPNDTALTFGHMDASSACGARRRRTRAQRSRQPRCFAGFRRCVHPILHSGSSTVVASTADEDCALKLSSINGIELGAAAYEMTPYIKPLPGTVRGVVHGITACTTEKRLVELLAANNCGILHARMLGKSTSAVITFEGPHVPFYVKVASSYTRCRPYRRSIQYCKACGEIGHRQDVYAPTQTKISETGAGNRSHKQTIIASCSANYAGTSRDGKQGVLEKAQAKTPTPVREGEK